MIFLIFPNFTKYLQEIVSQEIENTNNRNLVILKEYWLFLLIIKSLSEDEMCPNKSKNFGSWVYQLMIQFIVVSSFFLQDYISFIFSLVFFFVVFSFGVVVFLLFLILGTSFKLEPYLMILFSFLRTVSSF